MKPLPLILLAFFLLTLSLTLSIGCNLSRTTTFRSYFQEDRLITGEVVENSRGCEVDGECYLRIGFKDMTVKALYGSGEMLPSEKPLPCRTPAEASSAAFALEKGDIVKVEISGCDTGAHYIKQISRLEKE